MVRGREEAARKKEIRGGYTTSVICPKKRRGDNKVLQGIRQLENFLPPTTRALLTESPHILNLLWLCVCVCVCVCVVAITCTLPDGAIRPQSVQFYQRWNLVTKSTENKPSVSPPERDHKNGIGHGICLLHPLRDDSSVI